MLPPVNHTVNVGRPGQRRRSPPAWKKPQAVRPGERGSRKQDTPGRARDPVREAAVRAAQETGTRASRFVVALKRLRLATGQAGSGRRRLVHREWQFPAH